MRCFLVAAYTVIIAVTSCSTRSFACADGVACAVVKETDDNFVALRTKPDAGSDLYVKLRPYEIIIIYVNSCDPEPKWTFVESVPRVDGAWEYPKMPATMGYVRSSLIEYATCPTDLDQ
jgi:hypothetical protein